MIFDKMVSVYKAEGLLSLIQRSSGYLLQNVISYQTYYLIKRNIQDIELEPLKKVDNVGEVITKSIQSNKQADEIAAEYEDFRPYVTNAHRILDAGGIAFCLYVGKDVACAGWIATTETARRAMTDIPMYVDFDNKEAYLGYTYTVPKYRGKRLAYYRSFLRARFLREMGIITKRYAIRTNNHAAINASKFTPSRIVYSRARYLKLMGFKFWKEIPMNTPLGEVVDKR